MKIDYKIMGIPSRKDNIEVLKRTIGITDTDVFLDTVCRKNPMWTWKNKRGDDTFEWVRHTKEELIKKLAIIGVEKRAASLLSPELVNEFGVSAEDIKSLEHLWSKCEGKNAYYKVIADAYIENGSLTLTDEQKTKAFDAYNEARK